MASNNTEIVTVNYNELTKNITQLSNSYTVVVNNINIVNSKLEENNIKLGENNAALEENKKNAIDFGSVYKKVFEEVQGVVKSIADGTFEIGDLAQNLLGDLAKIDIATLKTYKGTDLLKEGFKAALSSPAIWATGVELAIAGINKGFEALNKNMDALEQGIQKQVAFQSDMQSRLNVIRSGVSKELEKSGTNWAEFLDKLGVFANNKTNEDKYRALIQYAKTHNDEIAKSILKMADLAKKQNEEARAAKNSAGATKELGSAIKNTSNITGNATEGIDSYTLLLDEFSKYDITKLNNQFDNLIKIQEQVNDGAIKLSKEGLEELNNRIISVGLQIDNLSEDKVDKLFEALIGNKTPIPKKIKISEISSGMSKSTDLLEDILGNKLPQFKKIELSDLLPDIDDTNFFEDLASGAVDVSNAILKWAPGISKALSALGLMTDDMSKLIEGVEGVATGITKIASSDLTGIFDIIASLPSLFDGLTESFCESFTKQWEAQGFDDKLSEDLINKIGDVSDKMGGKEYGMREYIEEIFKEVDITNKEEYTRLSDLLSEQIGVYLSQGHTMEEAYAKYGDELQELTDAQEKYGFEMTDSMKQMIAEQKKFTSAGRVGGITDAINGIQKMIDGMSKAGYSEESFYAVFGLLQNTFEKLRAEGLSVQEIFDKISPAVESARKAAEAAGISTAPMDDLLNFYQMMEDAAPLFDVISGIDMALKGLAETGTLTQSNLDALSQSTIETYQKMQAEGFTPDQIAAAMGSSILDIAAAAEKSGFTLSAEMQALVDQMTVRGIEPEKTETEILQEWSNNFLTAQKEWGDQMIKTFENFGSYQEGGVIPGSSDQATLAWLHGGETVIPAGVNLGVMGNENQSPRPVINITFSGESALLKDFIRTTVEDYSAHGDIRIRESSIV